MQASHRETVSKLLHTVNYDNRTQFMDPKEELYFMHFLKDDPVIGSYIKSQMNANPTFRRDVLNQPVCPRCEGFCFWHNDGAQCPSCGTWTAQNKTHKVKQHIRGGFHK